MAQREHDQAYSDDFEADDEEMEEVYAADDGAGQSEDTNKFDAVVQALEELMVDVAFQAMRDEFCRQHCHHFEDTEENKLEYTSIHEAFCSQLEDAMLAHLEASLPGFDMAWFMEQLQAREGELDAEVFDLLLGLSDFQAFKALMLDYRRAAASPGAAGLSPIPAATYQPLAATPAAAPPQQQPQPQAGFGRAPDTRRAADQAPGDFVQQLAEQSRGHLVLSSGGSEQGGMKAAAATSPGRGMRVGVCDATDMDT